MKIDRNQSLIIANLIKYYEMCIGDLKSIPEESRKQLEDFRKIRGICGGSAITHAVMNLPSSTRWGLSEWWDEVLTQIVLWDGEKASLEQWIMLKNSERVKTLGDIFDWFINVVLFNQSTEYHPAFALQDASVERLQFLIKNGDLPTPTEQMMKVGKVYKVSGRFNTEILEKILEDETTQAFIEQNICLVSYPSSYESRHVLALRYQTGKGWFLFDSNYNAAIDTRVFKQEIYFSTTKKLVKELIMICGNVLTIRGMVLTPVKPVEKKESTDDILKKPFAGYDQILEQDPAMILIDGGLAEFLDFTPGVPQTMCVNLTPEIKSRINSAVKELTLKQIGKHRLGSPLVFAIKFGFFELARTLIEKDINVNDQTSEKQTGLMCVSKTGKNDLFNLLLEHKAEINIQNDQGSTPLMCAAYYGREEMVDTLLARGARTDFIDNDKKSTALIHAMINGHVAVTRRLLDASPALINLQDGVNYEKLKLAIMSGRIETAKLFIEKLTSDSLDVPDEKGLTILMWAVKDPRGLEIVKLLLKRGANPNAKEKLGETTLMDVAYFGSLEIAKTLLESNARLDLYDNKGHCALSRAVQNKHETLCQLFLRVIQDSKDEDFLEKSKLIIAKADILALQFCITKGEIKGILPTLEAHPHLIDVVDEEGHSALMAATRCGDSARVEWLLARKPAPDRKLKNKAGLTAWQLAVKQGHYDVATRLFENDNKDQKDAKSSLFKAINLEVGNHTMPLIWWALKSAKASSLEWLVNNSVDQALTYRDSKGATLLMAAVGTGDAEKVRILLKNPQILAEVNAASQRKATALSKAVKLGRFDIVKLIVDCKAVYNGETSDVIFTELANRCDYPILSYLLTKKKLEVTTASLELSLMRGNFRMAGMLMNTGIQLADIPLKDLLQLSESKGEYVLQRRLDVELKDEHRVAMFKTSCQLGHVSIAKLLLESDNFSDFKSFLKTFEVTFPAVLTGSLMAAIKLTAAALSELLVKHDADIKKIDKDDRVRKSLAKEIKAKTVAKASFDYLILNNLLAKNISILAVTADSLELALAKKDFRIAAILIDAGLMCADVALKNLFRLTSTKDGKQTLKLRAGIELKDEQCVTMLKKALGAGHIAIAKLLLKLDDSRDFKFFIEVFELTESDGRFVNVNADHSKYGVPLMTAVRLQHEGLVDYLIRHGAYIGYPDLSGKTAVSLGREIKNASVIRYIEGPDQFHQKNFSQLKWSKVLDIEPISDINRPDRNGDMLLHYAVTRDCSHVVKFLMDKGAKNLPNYNQQTPLIEATMRNLCLNILLDSPYLDNLDFKDKYGKTAIYYLAIAGYIQQVKLLYDKGADCTQALEVAVDQDKPAIVEELAQEGKAIKMSKGQFPKLLSTALKKSHWKVAYALFANQPIQINGKVLFKLAEEKQGRLLRLFIKNNGDFESALQLAITTYLSSGYWADSSSLLLLVKSLSSEHIGKLVNKKNLWQPYASISIFVESLNTRSLSLGLPSTNLLFQNS